MNTKIDFISEDKKAHIVLLIFNNNKTIFQIKEMNSTPQLLLLTLLDVKNKLTELNITEICNIINKNELDMFGNKTVLHEYENEGLILINIKTVDFIDEMVKVYGIDQLLL